jgi:hypothetical protein
MYIGLRGSVRCSRPVLMNLEFVWQIFDKFLNNKSSENPFSWCRVVPSGQPDGHDEANSRFSQFCEHS